MGTGVAASFDRRGFLQAGSAAGLGLAGLIGGCTTVGERPAAGRPHLRTPPLTPIQADPGRITHFTVCLRPFRMAGPRLDAETVGDKLVVHNYGHGGAGWSLAWGSAALAVAKAMAGGERRIAVIGCGALGLASALTAQGAGADVTVYAREGFADTRSARATGVWSPSSRIALAGIPPPAFADQWEQMARTSFTAWSGWMGRPGEPLRWIDRYACSDLPYGQPRPRREQPPGAPRFAQYAGRVRDLTPRPEALPPGTHPFPVPAAQRTPSLMFNIAELGRQMAAGFMAAGGRIERREFHTPADLAALPERVVIDCTGYGARALWNDRSMVPVRGQLAWLPPQAEADYGVTYRDVICLSRREGVLVQATGIDDAFGYGLEDERPDRAEAEAAIAAVQPLFRGMARR